MKINLNEGQERPQIDKGVPMPKPRGGGRAPKWPVRDMQIGDSFFVPNKTAANMSGVVNYARSMNKGWKFGMRIMIENGVKGVRVWRTA